MALSLDALYLYYFSSSKSGSSHSMLYRPPFITRPRGHAVT